MNRSLFFVTLVLAASAAATSAFADDITIDPNPFVPSRSRSEVQAELAAFRQAGVDPWSAAYSPLQSFHTARTRAEVRHDYLASREEVRAMTAEGGGSSFLSQHHGDPADMRIAGPIDQQ